MKKIYSLLIIILIVGCAPTDTPRPENGGDGFGFSSVNPFGFIVKDAQAGGIGGGGSGIGNANPLPSVEDDGAGNLRIGTAANDMAAFTAFVDAVHLGRTGIMTSNKNAGSYWFHIASNGFFNGSAWEYIDDGTAGRIAFDSGGIDFSVASAGTAGNTMSLSDALLIDPTGLIRMPYSLGVGAAATATHGIYVYEPGSGASIKIEDGSGSTDASLFLDAGSTIWELRADGGTNDIEIFNAVDTGVYLTIADSTGDIEIGGGSLTSTKACATNYTRITPNYCLRDDRNSAGLNLVRDTCKTVTTPHADATEIDFNIEMHVRAVNSSAARYTNVHAYGDSSCATINDDTVGMGAYEGASIPNNTVIVSGVYQLTATNVSGNAYLLMDDDGGNNGVALWQIRGYYD